MRKSLLRSAAIVGLAWLAAACEPGASGPSGAAGATGTAGGAQGASGGAGAVGGSGGGGAGAGASGGSNGAGSGSGGAGTGGQTSGGTGGAGTGGQTSGGTGGAGTGGQTNGGTGGAGTGGSAPRGGAGGRGGSGGAARGGAGGGGGAGGSGGAGGGANGPFVCNQALGGKLIYELFIAGFETNLDNARWQLKWQDFGHIQEWANAQSSFWNAPIVSPCSSGSNSPDRVVLMVFSWTVTAQSDWRTYITQAVNNIKAKYTGVRRVDLINQVRGPNNMLCPTPPAAGETIIVSPQLEAAMGEVAAAFPGFVFLGPKMEVRNCADLQDGGPHLTTAGNMAAAVPLAQYFAQTQ